MTKRSRALEKAPSATVIMAPLAYTMDLFAQSVNPLAPAKASLVPPPLWGVFTEEPVSLPPVFAEDTIPSPPILREDTVTLPTFFTEDESLYFPCHHLQMSQYLPSQTILWFSY